MSILTEKIKEHIKEKAYPVFSFAISREGEDIEAAAVNGPLCCHDSYSVAKLFTVTALGFLYDEGKIKTDDKVTELLGGEISERVREAMDQRWNEVTVHMALTHRLGLPGGFLDLDCNDANDFGEDHLAYMLTYPMTGDHGVKSTYTDGAFYLLGRIVEKICGERMDSFLWKRLFSPLGFREVSWSSCPMGHTIGGTGLYLRTGDMVKLGEVYRCGGVYNGKRILSEEWVKTVFENDYEMHSRPFGTYGKGGMRGQLLLICPDKKMSLAIHSWSGFDLEELLGFIMKIV
ncbi:MAG: serine hydrolase [Ruminococcaceae bacterium]|nr:serine hydrolase [Oscillospiraceae bacterium]